MPTSQPRTVTTVFSIVQLLQPKSVIDIGVGHGKTGILLREFLDIMSLRYNKEEWVTRVYGIEAFSAYRNPVWDYAYDSVTIGDGLECLQKLPHVDLILALDVWEHFEQSYATQMLDACLKKAEVLLISTPKSPLRQADVFGNPFERHVSKWSPKDFKKVRNYLVTCTTDDWIILLSAASSFPKAVRVWANPMFFLSNGLELSISLLMQRLAS